MGFSSIFIRRPIATSLLMAAVALAGAAAALLLPVAPLPRVDFPTITVGAGLPGANPEVMASSVATPLERQFGRIAGLTEMTSSSTLGSTSITLQFDLNRDINAAARDVQAAINAAQSQLPANLPVRPGYRKVNPANAPALLMILTSKLLPLTKVYDAADSVLAQKIAQVPGVGEVFVSGAAQPAVRVDVDPTRLASYGLSLEDVRTFLGSVNVNEPKGMLWDGQDAYTLATNDQLRTAAPYRNLILTYSNGAPVRLSDVASVQDSVLNTKVSGLANNEHAVILFVVQQPGANIVNMVDSIKAILPQLQASISPAIHLDIFSDRTVSIRSSVHDVELTLLITIMLVVLVIFFFLREVRATAIPSVALPLSLLGTFGVMYLLHYSLDNISLMALTISTGFVVDDAIVVIENIARRLENGEPPVLAALRGARQIGFTVLSMSASLVAVFLPLLLMGGIVGRLFREFAVTLSTAVAVSLAVSLTSTPMLCAKFLEPYTEHRHGRVYWFAERVFTRMLTTYEHGLHWVLAHKRFTLLVTFGTVCLTVYLFAISPKGFFPQEDTGRIMGMAMADQDISFQDMATKQRQLLDIVLHDPAVLNAVSFTGSGTGSPVNTGRMFITLKPKDERKIGADAVIARLRPKLARVAGVTLFLQNIQDINVGGHLTGSQYQYTLEDADLQELNEWAPKMLAALRHIPELRDVNSDEQAAGLAAALHINRDAASELGVSPSTIDSTLYDAFGQAEVSTIYTGINQYHVVLEVPPADQQNPSDLHEIYVRSSTGADIPLDQITTFAPSNSPLAVNHQGESAAITLSFNLAQGASLGQAVDDITAAAARLGTPASLHGSFQGTAQAFQTSLKNEPMLITLALVTVYIVLGILYESYIHPITILSTLPSAGVGALLALRLFHMDLTVIALIGMLLLIGIVKKNAIMMIDFALEAERKEGKQPEDAILEASLLRFRPIMMTTMAAMLGALPLAIASGEGSELRRPLGVSIVGGLIVSQMLTLFTTPVVYLYMDRLRLMGSRLGVVRAANRILRIWNRHPAPEQM
jgi:multidrug efflux pump